MKLLIPFMVFLTCVVLGTSTARANPKSLKATQMRLSESATAYSEQVAINSGILKTQWQRYHRLCSNNKFESLSCANFKKQLDAAALQLATQQVQSDLLIAELENVELRLAEAISVNKATIMSLEKRMEVTVLKIGKVRRRQSTVQDYIQTSSTSTSTKDRTKRAQLERQLPTLNKQLEQLEAYLEQLLNALDTAQAQKATD